MYWKQWDNYESLLLGANTRTIEKRKTQTRIDLKNANTPITRADESTKKENVLFLLLLKQTIEHTQLTGVH